MAEYLNSQYLQLSTVPESQKTKQNKKKPALSLTLTISKKKSDQS